MATSTEFCVVYRFRVDPEHEATFVEGWRRMTESIRDQRGGLGSRLHRVEGDLWLAYAQWPNRAAWEQSRAMKTSANAEAGRMMSESTTESFPAILLDPIVDLLVPATVVEPPAT